MYFVFDLKIKLVYRYVH